MLAAPLFHGSLFALEAYHSSDVTISFESNES